MTTFNADSVADFMAKANQKYGGQDLGDTEAKPSFKYGGFKDGKIAKLEFSCPIEMDYAEFGSGKPDENNKKAIKKVAGIAAAHEKRHKEGYEKAFKDFDPKETASDLMGKTFKTKSDADKAIKDSFKTLQKALLDACLDLHKKEGVVDVDQQADGTFKITEKAAGATGCR